MILIAIGSNLTSSLYGMPENNCLQVIKILRKYSNHKMGSFMLIGMAQQKLKIKLKKKQKLLLDVFLWITERIQVNALLLGKNQTD